MLGHKWSVYETGICVWAPANRSPLFFLVYFDKIVASTVTVTCGEQLRQTRVNGA